MTHLANKQIAKTYLDAFAHPGGHDAAVRGFFARDAVIHHSHPFNDLAGPDAYIDRFLAPLQSAFQGLFRRDYILTGGSYDNADWVTCTGYYVGHFAQDWLGIKATGTLSYLRVGEFHRMENGQAVESWIYLDIPELMIAAGAWPIKDSPGRDRGYTGPHRGPATQDGLQLHDNDPGRSASSAEMVTQMLKNLATEDEAWRPYWHENMVWYGPAAFGSFVGIENFAGFQVPFENAFSDWSGGAAGNGVTSHLTRAADGDYIWSAGWPSLMCVRKGPFLDQPPSTDTLLMRVCDWWRREGDLLVENWVFVDIPDVLLQMGVDLFPGLHNVPPGPRMTS
ncbi:ester cyclase [Yoonia sp. F2084L]|uniref:nuclear transport factor 2 family protein n=1 Tax=Yoonia sp. F2084L TaxID=2926419 RepID=UPI001FF48EE3|nr:nuclear transport factor 2 family protein [Yoonia sp. F2084L]MCK0095372.1 ester cyclase [Yoonia sp. F2084L]